MNFFKYLHGESPNHKKLVVIYTIAFSITYQLWEKYSVGYNEIMHIIFWIISIDLVVGIMLNMTRSSKTFWHKQKVFTKIVFLLFQVIPICLAIIFLQLDPNYGFALYIFVFLSGIALIIAPSEWNQILSVILTAFVIYVFIKNGFPETFYWLLFAFTTKIIASFSSKSLVINTVEKPL
jgi:hypothetical protein